MSDLHDTDRSYLSEVIGHPASVSSLLGAITAGALLSVVGGLGPAAIPLLLWAGAESLAALFLPGSPVFREWVDRKRRAERREARRKELGERIAERMAAVEARAEKRGGRAAVELRDELRGYGARYERLRERLAAMARMVASGQVDMAASDLEKLDDATVDYLRLAYARICMQDRLDDAAKDDIDRDVARLERQLADAEGEMEQRKLRQAIADLRRVEERRRLLPANDAKIRAQLMAMTDAFEELHHHLATEGGGGDVARYLREATERLEVEEQLQANVEEELADIARKAQGRQRVSAGI